MEKIEIKEGFIPFKEFKTYYRIANPKGKKTPLLMIHGGPGSTHNTFELFDHLALEDDRPIISYDQLGCGYSSIESGHKELWKKETWVDELINLREFLKLDEIHILGQSWGGMLEIIYLCDYKPKGIKSITFSSTLASASLWEKETHNLLNKLDEQTKNILLKAEKDNNWDDEIVKVALDKYMHTFVSGPWKEGKDPECMCRKKIFISSHESYVTAWGESEFSPSGTLKDYEYLDKLSLITIPALISHGINDESTYVQNKAMYDHLGSKDKRLVTYNKSRHAGYYEEHEEYCNNIKILMNKAD